MKIHKRYVSVEGLKAHYLEVGEGTPLLLVASQLVRARTYRPIIPLLSTHFRLLVVELPGCGRSERLGDRWSATRYADWLAAFMSKLAIDRAAVIGHSNSGAVALMLAASHPGRVERLVIVDSVGARKNHSVLIVCLARAADAVLELGLTLRGWPDVLYNLLSHTRSFLAQVLAAARLDVLGTAPEVRAPTLIGWGRSDHTMPLSCAERLRALIPDSQLYLSRGSHDWCITNGEEFSHVVVGFVTARDTYER